MRWERIRSEPLAERRTGKEVLREKRRDKQRSMARPLTGPQIASTSSMGVPAPEPDRRAVQKITPASRPSARLNPCELEIDLFCSGLRIDPQARRHVELARRTRAGLGSGLELVIPGPMKPIWVNAPVMEPFARRSPYELRLDGSGFAIVHEELGWNYPALVARQPDWCSKPTSRGVKMGEIGALQGTYLGIYIGPVCRYWREPAENCKFCTTGLNVGSMEIVKKSVRDVVETCKAAQSESGVTFVHFNSGYQEGRDLKLAKPFLSAVKKETGLIVGLQLAPVRDLSQYDELIDLGADHFSFCFEFMNPEAFDQLCPGKARTLGQSAFFEALEYTSSKLGKGRVSGEIIAGVEPLEDTLKAIDKITDAGAFPTVCVFRPVVGSDMEDWPPPAYEPMREVFQYMIDRCVAKRIPIGIAPNIEVSLVVQPTDALYLASRGPGYYAYRAYNGLLSALMRPVFSYRLRRGRARLSAED